MSDNHQIGSSPARPGFGPRVFLERDWPYILMLIFAVLGVALVGLVGHPINGYWEILAPVFGAVCVYTRWRDAEHQAVLSRLIRIEALHWFAVIVAMQLIFITDVSGMMNVDAMGLMVMVILALGTFTAGAQIGSWQICIVGAVLGAGVPFVAWLERATLFVTLAAIAIVALVAFAYVHRKHVGLDDTLDTL